MDAIVMAGGFGQRLGMGEKPCVELLGKPLISYVIDTLRATKNIDRVFVAVSPVTPKTEIMIQERYKGEVQVIRTFGGNYVGDMIYAVETAQTTGPVMIIMSDLPFDRSRTYRFYNREIQGSRKTGAFGICPDQYLQRNRDKAGHGFQ